MLRQQQYWEFVSFRGNVGTLQFRKVGGQNGAFSETFERHQRPYYWVKCVGGNWVGMTVDCEWAITIGGVRYRTTGLLSDKASCCTVAVVTLQPVATLNTV